VIIMPEHQKKKEKKNPKAAKPHGERAPKPKAVKEAGGRLKLEPEPGIKVAVKPFTKEEVLGFLKGAAADFDRMEKLLDMPFERLYSRDYEFSTAYSARADADSIALASMLRVSDVALPDASKTVFTIAFVDSGSKTLFLLCDPEKRILVLEPLLYMGSGSWKMAAETLTRVLERKGELERAGKKYNFVIGYEGSVSVA